VVDGPQVRASCTLAARVLGAESCKTTEASGSSDLHAGNLRAQTLAGADRPLAETLQVGDRARLYSRDELQQSERGECRDGEQGHAFDHSRNTAGAS
jgi:hypothetical protein